MVGPHTPAIVEREIDGCFALLDPGTGRVVVLNETASDIWRLTGDEDLPFDTIVALLARAYDVGPDDIRDDVSRTVASLRDNGFLPFVGDR